MHGVKQKTNKKYKTPSKHDVLNKTYKKSL